MKNTRLSVIVWNEFIHERQNSVVRSIYPEGLHSVIATALKRAPGLKAKAAPLDISTATQDQPDHGLGEARLEACDVLIWWGHLAHDKVSEEVVARIHRRVLEGMGLIVLHSGYSSKIFKRLLGLNSSLKWRATNEKERLCVIQPSHPIAAGLKGLFDLPAEEMYSECIDGAKPDSTVFASRIRDGEAFASGCCWERGYGRLFYFRPGHINPSTFHNTDVQRILANAVQWVAPRFRFDFSDPGSPKFQCEERISRPCADYGKNTWSTSFSPDRTSKPFTATRSRDAIAEKDTPFPRHIEPTPLFPTLMSHLQQRHCNPGCHNAESNAFRKGRAKNEKLTRSA